MPQDVIDLIHIDLRKQGDTVEHAGKVRTVTARDLSHIEGMGRTLWGDSYALGRKPVKRITYGAEIARQKIRLEA